MILLQKSNSELKDDQVSWLWGHTNYQWGLTGLTQDDRCSHYWWPSQHTILLWYGQVTLIYPPNTDRLEEILSPQPNKDSLNWKTLTCMIHCFSRSEWVQDGVLWASFNSQLSNCHPHAHSICCQSVPTGRQPKTWFSVSNHQWSSVKPKVFFSFSFLFFLVLLNKLKKKIGFFP